MITTAVIAIALWEGGKWFVKRKLKRRGGDNNGQ